MINNKLGIALLITGVLVVGGSLVYSIMFGPVQIGESAEVANTTQVSDNSGCCIEPPCQECFDQQGFCDCQQREEAGLEACEECEASESCDQQSDVCEIDLE